MLTNINQSSRFSRTTKRAYELALWATCGIAYSLWAQAESIGTSSPGVFTYGRFQQQRQKFVLEIDLYLRLMGKQSSGFQSLKSPVRLLSTFASKILVKRKFSASRKKLRTEQRITLADTKMVSPPEGARKNKKRICGTKSGLRKLYATNRFITGFYNAVRGAQNKLVRTSQIFQRCAEKPT